MGIKRGGYDAGIPISVIRWQQLPGLLSFDPHSVEGLSGPSDIFKTPAHTVRGCFFVALTG